MLFLFPNNIYIYINFYIYKCYLEKENMKTGNF